MKELFNKIICIFKGHSWVNYTRSDCSFRHTDCRRCGKKGNWTEDDENSKEFFPFKIVTADGKEYDGSRSKKELDEIFDRAKDRWTHDIVD